MSLGTDEYRCTTRYGTDVLRVRYGCCVGHIVRPKSKQDGAIRSARQFRTSVGSGIDADRTGKRKLNFNGVLQDQWGSGEMATGVYTTGMGIPAPD